MCYSAMIRQNAKKYAMKFDIRQQPEDDDEFWDYRVFPHQEFPVVLEVHGERRVEWMVYSLIPKWSKERKPKFATYNARLETLCEKATWKAPIQTQRCLVGLTSFFESCYQGSHAGNIVEFVEETGDIIAAAGIYEQWMDPSTGEVVDSFAIITSEPMPFIKDVGHDRSPVFVNPKYYGDWLKPQKMSCDEARSFLLEAKLVPTLKVDIERPLRPGWERRKPSA
jgi:putative SOS response-associated peptidase YedK